MTPADGPDSEGPARAPARAATDSAPGTVTVLFFASAREAAGVPRAVISARAGTTVSQLVGEIRARYGAPLTTVLPTCAFWVNGSPAPPGTTLDGGDEVAVVPPVSGG